MNFLKTVTIKTRLTFLVGFSAAVMAGIGWTGLNGMNELRGSLHEIYADRLLPTVKLGRIIGLMRDNRIQLGLALQHDPANAFAKTHDHALAVHTDKVRRNIEEIGAIWADYVKQGHSAEEKRLTDAFADSRAAFVDEGLEPTLRTLLAGDYRKAQMLLLTKVNTLFVPADEAAERLLRFELEEAHRLEGEADANHDFVLRLYLGLLIGGIGAGILLAIVTIKGIGDAVRTLERTTDGLADGDLTIRADYDREDELGHVARAFNAMGERFRQVIQQVNAATSQLAAAAEQTSSVTRHTTDGARRQQAETEQVATAMNEMNATVHEVARNAGLAADSARQADDAAERGRQVVSRTVDVINELANEVERVAGVIRSLEEETVNIGGVLDVIRGIAEQTNLLALNAAIEAARAGDQGRGFAVVADEVRTLASRTQESTEEIQETISRLQGRVGAAVGAMDASQRQARTGVEQASAAGAALEEIAEAVARINDMNTQIASAAEEQSAVAEEINRNVVTINQVSEETAEGAIQTSVASEQLARLAGELQGLVRKFRV